MDKKNIPSSGLSRPFIPIIPMDDNEKDPQICPHCWHTLSSLHSLLFEQSFYELNENDLIISALFVYFRYLNIKLELYNKNDIKYLLHFEYNHQYICNLSIQDIYKYLRPRFAKCRTFKNKIDNGMTIS